MFANVWRAPVTIKLIAVDTNRAPGGPVFESVTPADGLGVLGSRMTGAGFGGCTVSLAHKDSVGRVVAKLAEYTERFKLTPGVFILEGNREAGPVR